MIVYIDIDDTIATNNGLDYSQSIPLYDNIKRANDLYLLGHYIVYYTSRGSLTGIDWKQTTIDQLNKWGVLYNELRLDKPYYDLIIDDKALNVKDWK